MFLDRSLWYNCFPFPFPHGFGTKSWVLGHNVVNLFFLKKLLKKTSPRSLVIGFCNSSSTSTFSCLGSCCGCSSAIGWVGTSSSLEFEMMKTSVGVEVVAIHLRKFKTTSSSSPNFLLLSCCSKVQFSSLVGTLEAKDSIKIALVSLTCPTLSFSICSILYNILVFLLMFPLSCVSS